VSDDLIRKEPGGLTGVWKSLSLQGYALTDDQELGLPANLPQNFRQKYFRSPPLRHDEGDWPIDRLRARDVIHYRRGRRGLELQEHESITITDRAGIPGKREHTRVWLLRDAQAGELLRALLQLVPPGRRKREGTLGVNLLRTFTDVVTRPHHDLEEFIIIYVLCRIGGGAETYLYQPDDISDSGEAVADPVLRFQLNPGDIVIFEDSMFKHGATPLRNPLNGTAMRDALVCTVDHYGTYLATM
jgi:hypothetical protein